MIKGGRTYRQRTSLKHQILERDKHVCQVCGAPAAFIDHIIPYDVSKDSTVSNLRAICLKCNLGRRRKQKNARLPFDEWCTDIERELKGG